MCAAPAARVASALRREIRYCDLPGISSYAVFRLIKSNVYECGSNEQVLLEQNGPGKQYDQCLLVAKTRTLNQTLTKSASDPTETLAVHCATVLKQVSARSHIRLAANAGRRAARS